MEYLYVLIGFSVFLTILYAGTLHIFKDELKTMMHLLESCDQDCKRKFMDYKGYELFEDVEDKQLQARNRAVVLWNIFENNSKNGKATPQGVIDMVQYTKCIPEEERKVVLNRFAEIVSKPTAVQ